MHFAASLAVLYEINQNRVSYGCWISHGEKLLFYWSHPILNVV